MRKLLLTGCGLVLALYLLPVFWPSEEAEPFTVPSAAATGAAAAPAGDYTTVTVEIDGTPVCGRDLALATRLQRLFRDFFWKSVGQAGRR